MGHYGGSYKVTYGLYKKYGDMRVLDTPICGECNRILLDQLPLVQLLLVTPNKHELPRA